MNDSDNDFHDDELAKASEKLKQSSFERPPLHTETLMHIFRFDDVALGANRSALATRPQKEALNDELRAESDAMRLMLTIFLGAALLVALILRMQGLPSLPLVIGGGLVIGSFFAYSQWRQNRIRRDLERVQVRSVQGQAAVIWGNAYRGEAWLMIGLLKFQISREQARALEEYRIGQLRVYYVNESKHILSAESLRDSDGEKLKNSEKALSDEEVMSIGRHYEDEESMPQKRR